MRKSPDFQPFRYHGSNGTGFYASHADLSCGVAFKDLEKNSVAQLAADVAQMIGHHALEVLPKLGEDNAFPGYNKVAFVLVCSLD